MLLRSLRIVRVGLPQTIVRSKATAAWNHCAHIVRQRDYENYLCAGLIKPNDLKRFALCLRAFNCEVASIKDQARSQDAARFRFLYWMETIEKLYDRDHHPPANEPIATELKQCLEKVDYKLPLPWFKKLIESRMNNLGDFPFATVKEFLTYQEQSVSPVYYLLLEYANRLGHLDRVPDLAKKRAELDHIASHLGKSHGLLNAVRSIHHNALMQQCSLPNELLAKHKCTNEDFIQFCYGAQKSIWDKDEFGGEMSGERFQAITNLVHEVATLSKQNLRTAVRIYNELGLTMRQTGYIFMPLYVIDMYLNDLEMAEFNFLEVSIFSRRHQTLPLWLFWSSFEFQRLK